MQCSDICDERVGLCAAPVSIRLTCFLTFLEALCKIYDMYAGGAFSRPNLVFNTAQPQLQISQNPPAAAMPSTLWPNRFPGSGSPPSNLYMPSIPEPHQAPPMPSQNGRSQAPCCLFLEQCLPQSRKALQVGL